MILQPEDFWSFYEWLMRPDAFLESALLQGIVLFVLAIVIGLMVGYIISANRYGPSEGFYAVARAVPGPDSIRFTRHLGESRLCSGKTGLQGGHPSQSSVCGRTVPLSVAAGRLVSESQSGDPARLYISFVLTATNYLILALALFISAFSLPTDIKSKTIYTIVTKPVRATEIVLGRNDRIHGSRDCHPDTDGSASYVFVSRGQSHQHLKVDEVVEEADGLLVGQTDYIQNHQHTFTMDPDLVDDQGNAVGLTDFVRGHRHIVQRDATGKFEIGPPEDALRARIPSYGEIQFYDRGATAKMQVSILVPSDLPPVDTDLRGSRV